MPRMLHDLEEFSSRYFFGGTNEILATCAGVLASNDVEEFEERLELVAKAGEFRKGLGMVLASMNGIGHQQHRDTTEKWPAVQAALTRVLGGVNAASIFGRSLFLLSLRAKCSARIEEAQSATSSTPSNPQAPDPFIWGKLLSVDRGDVCYAAVLSLLASRRTTSAWLGMCLAEKFREGQLAGIQLFASLYNDDESDEHLELAQVDRIDWRERWRKAHRVDEGIRALQEKWEDKTQPFSPFGDEDDNEDDYEDEDGWTPVGASA